MREGSASSRTARAARQRRSVAVATAIACATAGATGCLYFVDLTGLSGESATPADGSLDAAQAGDVASRTDAGDAASAADAPMTEGGGSPCAAMHVFCTDFDHGAVASDWTSSLNIDPPGALVLDDLAQSPPHAARMTRARTVVRDAVTTLTRRIATTWRRAIFQGDLYLVAPAWQSGDVNFGLVHLVYNSATLNSGTVYFFEPTRGIATIEHLPDSAERYLPIDPMPTGRWVHVVVDFDPAGHVHYDVGGKSFDRDFAGVTPGDNPVLALEIGAIQYNSPAPAVDVRFDNVVVDLP